MESYSTPREDESLIFSVMWMDREGTMPSEGRRGTDTE